MFDEPRYHRKRVESMDGERGPQREPSGRELARRADFSRVRFLRALAELNIALSVATR